MKYGLTLGVAIALWLPGCSHDPSALKPMLATRAVMAIASTPAPATQTLRVVRGLILLALVGFNNGCNVSWIEELQVGAPLEKPGWFPFSCKLYTLSADDHPDEASEVTGLCNPVSGMVRITSQEEATASGCFEELLHRGTVNKPGGSPILTPRFFRP